MIIGEKFLWLHFPKCAGTFTEKLLRQHVAEDTTIKFDPIDPNNVIWHQNVSQREEMSKTDLSNKDIICNFRRLPHWIISRVMFEEKRSGHITKKELYTTGRFLEYNGLQSSADAYVKLFTNRKINNWIRVENLEEDFIKVFSKYIKFKSSLGSSSFSKKVNTSDWGNNIKKWFDYNDLRKLYNSCPLWSKYEIEIYGDIILDKYSK